MQIGFNKHFIKKYKKLPIGIRNKFDEQLVEFTTNPFLRELNNHALHGKYLGCRSINITGDVRAIYEMGSKGVRFINIDNHNNLYK